MWSTVLAWGITDVMIMIIIIVIITITLCNSPPWEANSFSASHEVSRILWIPKINYRGYKCWPLVSVLSQINPVLNLPSSSSSYFLKIQCINFILPRTGTLGCPSCIFPQGFPTTPCAPVLSPIFVTCSVHLVLLYLVAEILFVEPSRSWSASLCSLTVLYHLVRLRPKYIPQHPIFKYPKPMFLPHCERSSFAPM
jgi:hypothetical protein